MNKQTQELTYGAMLVAVFGLLLVINRQTAGLFEEVIFFVLPIPMTIFSLRYGWKDSIPVFVCMAALSFFLGTFYTIFYAVTNALLGIVLGTCLKNHWNLNQTQLTTMLLSAIFNVLSSVVLASLFGIDLAAEIREIQARLTQMLASAGTDTAALGSMLSAGSLMRMYIITMVFLGIMQGFIIFRLSLLILRRLRLPVPQPQPVGIYYPPRWSGYAALAALFMYVLTTVRPLENNLAQNLAQILGLVGYIWLLIFGWTAVTMLIRRLLPGRAARLIACLVAVLMIWIMPYFILIMGFLYISTGLHDRLLLL